MARVSTHLEQLVREAEVLSSIKNDVPNAWKILEMEIGRARAAAVRAVHADHPLRLHCTSTDSPAAPCASPSPSPPPASLHEHPPRHSVRKRVKLRVPADQYPEYNFVGRLLGPRGATLKRLERDTGCRIMIRGKGSIRKDKEADVRGKPGWEHVFNEPLHVVIEVVDSPDDISATRILNHAKQLVEILLIPVPEERDSLKRAQLRDLAILNGTHRSVSDLLGATSHNVPLPTVHRSNPLASSPPPLRRAQSQHNKPSQKMYANDYANMFEPLLPFARHNSFSPPAPAVRPLHTLASYSQPNTFAPSSHDSLVSELEKLRIPALDFDHINDATVLHHTNNNSTSSSSNNNNNNNNLNNNLNNNNNNLTDNNNNNTNSNNNTSNSTNFPLPVPSPTIVDPEIYPYPPTPGLLTADQQLSAFASPTWTPSRAKPSAMSSISSSSLPPRSPLATADNSNQPSSSFLLGRTLGDFSRHSQPVNHEGVSSPSMEGISFEQSFGSHGTQFADLDAHKHPFSSMRNSNGDAIVLANLFGSTSGGAFSNVHAFDSHGMKQHTHGHQSSPQQAQVQAQSQSQPQHVQGVAAVMNNSGHDGSGRSSPLQSGGGGTMTQEQAKASQDC
eukprot:TRINITY_DN616_c0_g1_i1.p1 TRINITY_DN616_c0_g1~~TRINITY_DN616_c0_g1_i1.p1  ORF type:complete len:690 (+),score=135.57 TRINITY_DN616_c0_g1_i1:220-2070(+)